MPAYNPKTTGDPKIDGSIFDIYRILNWMKSEVEKVCKKITVIVNQGVSPGTLDHALLNNLNSISYTHLTAANATDLTDGGATTLHSHANDHARSHALDSTSDHSSTITPGAIVVAAATTGLPKASVHLSETATGVGIGTTVPDALLSVWRGTDELFSGTGYRVAKFNSTAAVNADRPGITLGYDTTGGGIIAPATQAGTTNFLSLWTYNGAWGERMRLTKEGNVGIGTTAPLCKLCIDGGLHVGGASDAGDDNLLVDGTANIGGDIYSVARTSYGSTSTITGFSTVSTANIYYKKVGKLVFCNFCIIGTSNATSFTFTLPYGAFNDVLLGSIYVNDSAGNGIGLISYASSKFTLYKNFSMTGWASSGTKNAEGNFWFETT